MISYACISLDAFDFLVDSYESHGSEVSGSLPLESLCSLVVTCCRRRCGGLTLLLYCPATFYVASALPIVSKKKIKKRALIRIHKPNYIRTYLPNFLSLSSRPASSVSESSPHNNHAAAPRQEQ
jgi:hypothetical protein